MLIHFSEDGERLEAIDRFFRLIRPNYLTPSRVVLSELGLESFSKESNEVGLFWSSVSIKHDKDRLEKR